MGNHWSHMAHVCSASLFTLILLVCMFLYHWMELIFSGKAIKTWSLCKICQQTTKMLQGLFRIQRRHSVTWNLCIQKNFEVSLVYRYTLTLYTCTPNMCNNWDRKKWTFSIFVLPSWNHSYCTFDWIIIAKGEKDVLIYTNKLHCFCKVDLRFLLISEVNIEMAPG